MFHRMKFSFSKSHVVKCAIEKNSQPKQENEKSITNQPTSKTKPMHRYNCERWADCVAFVSVISVENIDQIINTNCHLWSGKNIILLSPVPSWMPVFVLMPSLVASVQCGRAKYNTHFIPWKFHLIYWITLISSIIEHIDADVLQCECATSNATKHTREREIEWKKPPRERWQWMWKKEWPPNSKNRPQNYICRRRAIYTYHKIITNSLLDCCLTTLQSSTANNAISCVRVHECVARQTCVTAQTCTSIK